MGIVTSEARTGVVLPAITRAVLEPHSGREDRGVPLNEDFLLDGRPRKVCLAEVPVAGWYNEEALKEPPGGNSAEEVFEIPAEMPFREPVLNYSGSQGCHEVQEEENSPNLTPEKLLTNAVTVKKI